MLASKCKRNTDLAIGMVLAVGDSVDLYYYYYYYYLIAVYICNKSLKGSEINR